MLLALTVIIRCQAQILRKEVGRQKTVFPKVVAVKAYTGLF